MKAGIIGMGIVGKSQAALFHEYDLVTYDLSDDKYPENGIAACEFAVICVGTPPAEDGSADLWWLHNAVQDLPGTMPILIRSTVPPGTIDQIQKQRKGITAHSPDFLYEGGTGPWRMSINVPWMLLGGDQEACKFFRPRLEKVFPGYIHECSALTAELTKYTANLYWAMRVTFVNEMSAICDTFGGDWEEVRAAWLQDSRINKVHTAMAGFPPGFGGRCWPKDLSALIAASHEAGYDAEFLSAIEEANARFQS